MLGVESLDFRLDPILELPGLYYEQLGEDRLSSSEWKISKLRWLAQVNVNFDVVKQYDEFTVDIRRTHERSDWTNLTECTASIKYTGRKNNKLE